MILLDSTGSLEVVLAGAATTQPQYYMSFVDVTTTTYAPQESHGATNSTTPVTMVSAPSAGTQRQLKYLSIFNRDNASVTITVSLNVSAALTTMWHGTLEPNEMVQYVDGDGWTELDSGGLKKSALVYGGGQFIRNSYSQLSNGTAVLSGLQFGIDGQTITARASTMPFFEPLPGCNMSTTSVNAYLGSVLRLMPVLLYNDLNMSRIKYMISVTSSNAATTLTVTMSHGLYTKNGNTLSLYTNDTFTTAITYATSRGSLWSGHKEWTIPCSWSLSRGQYWYASKAAGNGASSLLGTFFYPTIGFATTTAGWLGTASTALRQQNFFGGLMLYTATNTSTLPATIVTSQLNMTNGGFQMPYQIWMT